MAQSTIPAADAPAPPPRRGNASRSFPPPNMVKGQPIETRVPEKADDKPAFAGQTRAPYEATDPPVVTTLTDQLKQPWSLAFLPDGKILITEKPGTMRLLDKAGMLSPPLTGLPPVN